MSEKSDTIESWRLHLLSLAFDERGCDRYVNQFRSQFEKSFERVNRLSLGDRLRYAGTLFDKGEFEAGRYLLKSTFQFVESICDGAEMAQAAEGLRRTVFPTEVK
jgi:hypothetical protein